MVAANKENATGAAALRPEPLSGRGTDISVFRRSWIVALTLAILALGLSLPRLGTPNQYVFDELYYAYTAGKYVAGDDDAYQCCKPPRTKPAIEWTHPPGAKLLIAGGILAFGDDAIGWRAASAVFGVLGVLVTYFLAFTLTGSQAIASVGSVLLLLDGLYLVESRTGMSNLFLLVFANAALLAFAVALTLPPGRAKGPLLATGGLLGLAVATKWSAVALLGLVGLVYCWRGFRNRGALPGGMAADLGWGSIALAAIPIGIYLLSYGHFFLSGHGWPEFVSLHQSMLGYHRELGIVHPYTSSWWEWPMAARPVWYYAVEQGQTGSFVFANGNPLLYWPMVIAAGWVAIDWWGRRPIALTILVIGFFGQWLPWALSPRGSFIYHFLPAVPLGGIALAVVIHGAWRNGTWQRGVTIAYVAAVVATFVYFYPLYTAMPLTPQQVDARMWIASWR